MRAREIVGGKSLLAGTDGDKTRRTGRTQSEGTKHIRSVSQLPVLRKIPGTSDMIREPKPARSHTDVYCASLHLRLQFRTTGLMI